MPSQRSLSEDIPAVSESCTSIFSSVESKGAIFKCEIVVVARFCSFLNSWMERAEMDGLELSNRLGYSICVKNGWRGENYRDLSFLHRILVLHPDLSLLHNWDIYNKCLSHLDNSFWQRSHCWLIGSCFPSFPRKSIPFTR